MDEVFPNPNRCLPIAVGTAVVPYCYYDPEEGALYFRMRWRGKNMWQRVGMLAFVEELRRTHEFATLDGTVYNNGQSVE